MKWPEQKTRWSLVTRTLYCRAMGRLRTFGSVGSNGDDQVLILYFTDSGSVFPPVVRECGMVGILRLQRGRVVSRGARAGRRPAAKRERINAREGKDSCGITPRTELPSA